MKSYDVVILGGGPGGYVAAIKAAQAKLKVAVIEKETVGGICLNHGCIPTKALLKNVKVLKTMKQASDYGVICDGPISYDWQKMLKRKNTVVKRLTIGIAGLLKSNQVDLYTGFGEVISDHEILVNDEKLTFTHLIIATGASPIIPPIPGLKEGLEQKIVLTSRELLQIERVPESLVIIGGGVIGVEFATIFAALGTKITIIEKQPQILPMMDEEIILEYRKALKKEGINVVTSAEVIDISNHTVTFIQHAIEQTIETDHVLLSVGMKANIKGIESLQLDMDKSAIMTDAHMRTSKSHIYAIGDCNGKFMLAHVASHEATIAVDHMLNEPKSMQYDFIPNAVYGALEIATIGMTEQEVINKQIPYTVAKFPVMALGKALADHEKEGMIKMITKKDTHDILGVHILSYNASDLIAEIGVTIELGGTAYHLAHTIHPHPTLSELILEVSNVAIGKPIHL